MKSCLPALCCLFLGVAVCAPAAPVVLYETGWEAAPAIPAWSTGAVSPQNGWQSFGSDPQRLRVVAEGSADAIVFGQGYATPFGSRLQRFTASTSTTNVSAQWAWPDLTAAWAGRPAGHDVLVASLDVLVPAGGSADNSYYGLQGYSPEGTNLYFGIEVTPAGRFLSLTGTNGALITERSGVFAYDTWFNLAIRVNFQTGLIEALTNGVPVPGLAGTNTQLIGAFLADVDLFCANAPASPTPRVVFTDNFRVTVDVPPGASGNNDDFANRWLLSGDPVTVGGNNVEATDEPFEPEHSAIPGSQSGARRTLWYSWTPPFDTVMRVTLTRTNGTFPNPMLAVWTGSSLATLSSVASNFSGVAACRIVIPVTGGTAYHIAVEDTGADNGLEFQLKVETLPQPANDAFAGRSGIVEWPLDTLASFLGASREAGEPTHGSSVYPQTLWWTWTAPAGALTNRVTLHADAISLPPDIGIYSGTSFPLTPVPGVVNESFGMTRLVSFLATPGATYQIALAGRQSDPAPNAASAQFGNVRLRFNASTLALLVTNRTALTNFDSASPFFETTLLTNGLRIENWGNAASRPVRVRLEASPGYSLVADRAATVVPAVSNLFTSSSVNVGPLQRVSMLATGRCPAPVEPDFREGLGWGVYALLEEQVGTAWFVVDHQLAGFGLWPDVAGFNGPGGGVMRIDPQAGGGTLCVPRLLDFQIQAPTGLNEGASVNLSATAFFNCPSNYSFTTTVWSNSHPATTVTTNGVLRAGSVTSNTVATVTCFFEYKGVLSNATRQVVISNLPPPRITTGTRLPNGRFQLGGTAVSDRRHSVQASTNLCCPGNWVNLMPGNLVATNGLWSFLDTNAPNHPRRFYRVQELD